MQILAFAIFCRSFILHLLSRRSHHIFLIYLALIWDTDGLRIPTGSILNIPSEQIFFAILLHMGWEEKSFTA